MSRAIKVKYIGLHCSAGFGDIDSIKAFWKGKGWKSPGYHIIIDLEGNIHYLLDFEKVSNGVLGFNEELINICYIGGIEKKDGKYIGKDTRTRLQKIRMTNAVVEVIEWLRANGNDCSDVTILGHRDFSPDNNGNGVIESWERIKECPSFDAIEEYKELQLALNNKQAVLPKRK